MSYRLSSPLSKTANAGHLKRRAILRRSAVRIRTYLTVARFTLVRMRHCNRAVSAVEFALISPVLILLFFATIDYGRAFIASYRAGFVADTIAELVSQTQTKQNPLSDDAIKAFIQAAPLIDPDILMWGRQTNNKNLSSLSNITVSSIAMLKSNASCASACVYVGAVVFSRALSGPTRPCGIQIAASDNAATSMTALPKSIFGPVDMIVVDVSVFFKPIFINSFFVPTQFDKSAYFRPRNVTRITSTSNCTGY